jgi:hypothetical protein
MGGELTAMTERQILLNAISVGGINHYSRAEGTPSFGTFGRQQMAFAGAHAHDFARGGDFEPLGHGLLCFDAFRTSHNFELSL